MTETAKNRTKNNIPLRTCVVCGTKSEKQRLIRFVAIGVLAVDNAQRLPGRGLYVCNRLECINGFRNQKTALKVLRGRRVPKDELSAFADALTEVCRQQTTGLRI